MALPEGIQIEPQFEADTQISVGPESYAVVIDIGRKATRIATAKELGMTAEEHGRHLVDIWYTEGPQGD